MFRPKLLDPDKNGFCGSDVYIASAMSKIPFSQDSQINKVQVRKSYFVPLNQSNGSNICTRPGQTLSLQRVFQIFCMCSGRSFIVKYNCWRAENHLLIFDSK